MPSAPLKALAELIRSLVSRAQRMSISGDFTPIRNLSFRAWTKAHLTSLWTAPDLEAAVNGKWLIRPDPGWFAAGINYERRKIRQGNVAFAIDSKKWGAGIKQDSDSLNDLFERGAACVIVSRPPTLPPERPVLLVNDSRSALNDIGRAARARLKDTRIIAVTGSAGKTTTKEFTRHFLSPQAPTFGSRGNYNHGPGVPLMLASTPVNSRFGVYEFAVDEPWITLRKAKILRPHVAVITCIQPDHLHNYGTLEALSDQKCLLFDALEPGGIVVLNRDDGLFQRQLDNARAKGVARVITFGKASESEFQLIEADLTSDGSRAIASIFGTRVEFDLNYPGEYMLMNCLAGLAAVHAAGGDWRKAVDQTSNLPQLPRRNERHIVNLDRGSIEFIDDSFSANPASVRAGLSVLKLKKPPTGGRRIAVISEIKELGTRCAELHAELAPAVRECGVNLLFTSGTALESLREALPDIPGLHSEDPDTIAEAVAGALRPGDVVWVKGSRHSSAGLKRIIASVRRTAQE
jgi:UDP-N-acetylmuramoyl-tripeptide--D-alanyl-D-alanine ligase